MRLIVIALTFVTIGCTSGFETKSSMNHAQTLFSLSGSSGDSNQLFQAFKRYLSDNKLELRSMNRDEVIQTMLVFLDQHREPPMEPIPNPSPEPMPEPLPDPQPTPDPIQSPEPNPGFSATAKADFSTGNLSQLGRVRNIEYSEEIAGPFGDAGVAKQIMTAHRTGFGGNFFSGLDLREGDEVWLRMYTYFPESFCFGHSNENQVDGSGSLKWFRFDQENRGRMYGIQLGGFGGSGGAIPRNGCDKTAQVYGGYAEIGGNNGLLRPLSNMTAEGLMTGRWQALQVYMKLSSSNGIIRAWVDDVPLGEYNGGNNTIEAGQSITTFVFGDYWNGGVIQDQHFYIDEVILTTEIPSTVDANGFNYISPTTRASDL